MTYDEAMATIPEDAAWSAIFGNVGEPGCCIYFRRPDGTRYALENGTVNANAWGVRIDRPVVHS